MPLNNDSIAADVALIDHGGVSDNDLFKQNDMRNCDSTLREQERQDCLRQLEEIFPLAEKDFLLRELHTVSQQGRHGMATVQATIDRIMEMGEKYPKRPEPNAISTSLERPNPIRYEIVNRNRSNEVCWRCGQSNVNVSMC
jgi:hypothetical protein